jgi:hypothetical protein
MGEHDHSFIASVRARFDNRRSHSSPPDNGAARAGPVPRTMPMPRYATDKVEQRQTIPRPAQQKLSVIDPYSRYDPQKLQPAIQTNNSPRSPRSAIAEPTTPLLQLPRPRASWRRSLGDMSADSVRRYWDDEDPEAARNSVDLACALPPMWLDQPPRYQDVNEAAKEIRATNPWATGQDDARNVPLPTNAVPSITTSEPGNRDQSRRLTIDDLLRHDLLRGR